MKASTAENWPLSALGYRGQTPARVAVLGLARSGIAAAKLLLARGVRVQLWGLERPQNEGLDRQLQELISDGGDLRLGAHEVEWLDEIDLIVKSPGVDPRIPFLRTAVERGRPIVGEFELASLVAEGPIVAVTGTNGKSTTTAWIGHMLETAGLDVEVVGNIGRPFSEGVARSPQAIFVAEASSFQLEDTQTFRPRVATWLNFSPDHLDRHEKIEVYEAAKRRIFLNQRNSDVAVLGDDPVLDRLALNIRCLHVRDEDRGEEGAFVREDRICLRFAEDEIDLESVHDVALPGPHNLHNAMAAAASAFAVGAGPEAIASSLTRFPGLSHRLEQVGTIRGFACINDSKATNVDSLKVALQSFSGPVHLIAGGVGKNQEFSRLAEVISRRTASVHLIGEAAPEMASVWEDTAFSESFEAAIRDALDAAETAFRTKGVRGRILLSPGCASFDMFRDYEERGDAFREYVAGLAKERGE